MQLTNILRDVREDFDMGRIYIPAEELRRYGVDEGVLAQRETPPELRELVRRLCEVAREHYRAAEPGIALLPDDGSRTCVSLMSALYSRILVKIRERDYNVLASRAHVPAVEKFGIAARMAMQTHRSERKHRCTNG
jgi:phytoene synthase